MNARAEELGMTRTMFTSPNGLDDTGYSSAADLVRLTRAAYRSPGFPSVVATRFHTVESLDAKPRIVQNRNVLLWLYPGAIGVKTGYTSPAGFCLVGAAQRGDERLVAVVLGAPGEPFSAAATLLNYGFDAFERRTLLREGERLDDVDVGGRGVSVSAGGEVLGLIPAGATVSRTVDLESHVAFPPARGEEIGIVRVSAGGEGRGRGAPGGRGSRGPAAARTGVLVGPSRGSPRRRGRRGPGRVVRVVDCYDRRRCRTSSASSSGARTSAGGSRSLAAPSPGTMRGARPS